MAEDAEGARGIPEGLGGFGGRAALDIIGSKHLILALFGVLGLKEEAAGIRYDNWCSYKHDHVMSLTTCCVNTKAHHNLAESGHSQAAAVVSRNMPPNPGSGSTD